MRLVVASALLWAAGTEALQADTDSFVSQMYDRFAQSCGMAFTDPQVYVNSVPPQNARGKANVVASPDGKVVKAAHAADGFAEDVTFARHADHLPATCIVVPHPDHPEFQRSIQIMAQIDGLNEYSNRLAEAIARKIPENPGITLVGGHTPIDDIHDYYADGSQQLNLEQSRHYYSFALEVAGAMIPSIIAVELGNLSVYSARSIEVAQ